MGGHVIPEAQKVTAVMNALPRPLSTLYTLLYPLHGKTFQVFEKNWKLDLSMLKILVGSEESPVIFLPLKYHQPAEA
jgi:hypothetical protein